MVTELFRDRLHAGHKLAERLIEYKDQDTVVLAIPRGGVPVGFEIAKHLNAQFDVIIPRKIPIPWNPEAGLGAVTADGTMVLNERMIRNLGLSKTEIDEAAEEVRQEIERRTQEYRDDQPEPDVRGRPVILVDDGLASGYTMLAAVESLKKADPSSVIVAVPVASRGAARLVAPEVDDLVALVISDRLPFAVADFYMEWRDLTDAEVIACLKQAQERAG